MKLTPLEIKQKHFANSFRGVERREVEDFLELVAEEMEALNRENMSLKDLIPKLEKRIESYREREKALKETLLTAQKMAEDMKKASEKEARLVLGNAELEGERLMRDAVKRREKLISDIHELKRQKVQFETTLRNVIEVHLKMLEALREHEEKEEEPDNLAFLKRPSEKDRREGAEVDDILSEEK